VDVAEIVKSKPGVLSLTSVVIYIYGSCMPAVEIAVPDGPKIRKLRVRRFRTQDALAAQIGRHRSWVSAMENGQRRQSLALMCDVADALGVEVDEIILAADLAVAA
jgi:DNA-binding XRE family transcriptional regulator